MGTDSPAYRPFAGRLVRHYKDNPTAINWQLDNETSSYDAGTNLLDGKVAAKGAEFTMAPWDLDIIEEP